MDEPTDGLDPNQKFVVRQMIKEMSAAKVIIVSTHILEEVAAVCSRAIVIADGQLVANSTPEELRSRDPQGRMDIVFRNLTLKEEINNG
jgi:ABC-2 type transport system ATP-binding protein